MCTVTLGADGRVQFDGELVISSVGAAHAALEAFRLEHNATLDTTAVTTIDFAGVQLLEWFARKLHAIGLQVAWQDGASVTRARTLLGWQEADA